MDDTQGGFVRVNLRRGKGHDHPDIKSGQHYLARIWGVWWFGTFSREWFGWAFNCGFGASGSIQFDAPGSNGSKWTALYKVILPTRRKKNG